MSLAVVDSRSYLSGDERYGLAVRGATPEALRLPAGHPWRGNVRELEAVLEQAMIFRRGAWITGADLDLQEPDRAAVAEGKASAERQGRADEMSALSWLQHEAVRMASERRELGRREFVARFRISREAARRELAGLVRLGLLRLTDRGRGARYVPLSFWLSLASDALEWAAALV